MAKGIDSNANCSGIAPQIADLGMTFVGRYYANSGKKCLTPKEAYTLRAAGLQIVALWEDGSPTRASYFSYAKGVDDSTSAYHDGLVLGQPKGSPIYFTVDFDADRNEISGVINDYFKGIAVGLAAVSGGIGDHAVGVYGSGATCSWLLARKLATYSWLAMSKGWRDSDFDGWTIKQSEGGSVSAVAFDADQTSSENYGGFVIS